MTTQDEAAIEAEIQAKGLDMPRLTPEHIDAQIIFSAARRARELFGISEETHGPAVARAMGCLTVCVMVLENGYTIIGKSACASPENYNHELGAKIAYADARDHIWALEGYALREKLSGENK